MVISLHLETDSFEANIRVGEDGSVTERGSLLFTDPEFLERPLKEKARQIREARTRILQERFGRKNRSSVPSGAGQKEHIAD